MVTREGQGKRRPIKRRQAQWAIFCTCDLESQATPLAPLAKGENSLDRDCPLFQPAAKTLPACFPILQAGVSACDCLIGQISSRVADMRWLRLSAAAILEAGGSLSQKRK